MEVSEKLLILADSAKYDVSCASSGVGRRGKAGLLGSAGRSGICHSWSADGRCISLLKVLYSNVCLYDCRYCVNRSSRGGRRVSFTPRELAELTISFYRRNYIEGLFLSSGVFASPDRVMEELCRTARLLRVEYGFNGYIHMKAIPGASPGAIDMAGVWVDRMSVNIELPSEASLRRWAPDKKKEAILLPMQRIKERIKEGIEANQGTNATDSRSSGRKKGHLSFIPAGQSTQLIVGASPEGDGTILRLSDDLYRRFGMRRVYYSAYIKPSAAGDAGDTGGSDGVDDIESAVGAEGEICREGGSGREAYGTQNPGQTREGGAVHLKVREHRLYQADWLMRFYGFRCDEILQPGEEFLDAAIDPKSAWALRNRDAFPVDLQRADYQELLRVPGIGVRSARRIIAARREGGLTFELAVRLGVVLKRARYFITCGGLFLEGKEHTAGRLRQLLVSDGGAGRPDARYGQLYLFDAVTGEL